MKKSEIIEEYNSLTQILNDHIAEYERVTGKRWEGTPNRNNMSPSCVNDYKDHLEARLNGRKSSIHSIREAINAWKRTEDLKNTEEGRTFIGSYEEKKRNLENRMDAIERNLVETFERILGSVRMGNWKVSRRERILPERGHSYFEIYRVGDDNTSLSISIDITRKFGMDVSSSMHYGGDRSIDIKDENYWQFKGYVTIHDNHVIFTNWMDNEYRKANTELRDIREEIGRIDKILEDPMSEYIVSKVGEKMTF